MISSIYKIKSNKRSISPVEVGNGSPCLIVNLGITNDYQKTGDEINKAHMAQRFGASMIADVTTIGDIHDAHQIWIANTDIPLNTVPLYDIYQKARLHNNWNEHLSKSLVLDCIEADADIGVDCMTLHSAYGLEDLSVVANSSRRIRVQARGGGIVHEYLSNYGKENPLLEHFDEILPILKRYGVTLSIGCCLRTGTIDDKIDFAAILELNRASDLARRAHEAGVNVMLEGFSHIRYGMINAYVRLAKTVCQNVPLRLLGPLGTEKGLGYDHITAAICIPEAIRSGVDLLTIVTRAEHIGLPTSEEIREALVAARISVELATQTWKPDENASTFMCGLGFENLREDQIIDLEKAVELKKQKNNGNISACAMCSETCRIKLNPDIVRQISRSGQLTNATGDGLIQL